MSELQIVNKLPTPPSRMGRASEFVRESTIFLALLPKFREEVNALAAHVNSINVNIYNFGEMSEAIHFPSIEEYLGEPFAEWEDVEDFVSQIDLFCEAVYNYSVRANVPLSLIEDLITKRGQLPSDIKEPLVSGVSYPPSKNDQRQDFNARTEDFAETFVDHINSIKKAVWDMWWSCYKPEDFGGLNEDITEILDCGLITDTPDVLQPSPT